MSIVSGIFKESSNMQKIRGMLPKAGISSTKIPRGNPALKDAPSINHVVNANAAMPGRYMTPPWGKGSSVKAGAVRARVKKKAREQELIQAEINKVDELFGIKPKR